MPEAKDVRNMREHDTEYIKGKGIKQSLFVKIFQRGKYAVDATSTITTDEGHLIGGRINLTKVMDASEKLIPILETSLENIK